MNGHVNQSYINDTFDPAITKNGKEISNEKGQETDDLPAAPQRDTWGKSTEFLMSCIAMSVGLGNIWRFPFTALENGGGAFLIPYIIVLVLVGRPIYYLEMLLGQFSSRGSVKVYDFSPAMRGVGYGQILATGLVSTYYASLMALTVRYFVASFSSTLPWSVCSDEWENCISSSEVSNNSTDTQRSSAELYFLKTVLNELPNIDNGIGSPDWKLTLCLIFSWTMVLAILVKGVRSSGKFSYFLALFPYVVMAILLVRAVTLPGAGKGIMYFITPQWDKILDPQVWYAAVTQVFFSLSVCFGNIIMYSSYNNFSHQIKRDANIVTSLDTCTSLLAGVTIFGILGNLAHEIGTDDISTVVNGGTGLAFISYPEAIAKFTFAPQFFAVLFFLMLFVLGIGSNVAMMSCLMTVIRDQFPKVKAWQAAVIVSISGMCIGLIYVTPGGQFMLNLVDHFGASFIVFVLAIFELLAVSYIYGLDRFCKDVEFMLKIKTGIYWRLCWGFITPGLMIIIFIYSMATYVPLTYQNVDYPAGAIAAGWVIAAFGLLQLPIWAFVAISRRNDINIKQRILGAFKPLPNWGPLDPTTLALYKKYVIEVIIPDEVTTGNVFHVIRKHLFGR